MKQLFNYFFISLILFIPLVSCNQNQVEDLSPIKESQHREMPKRISKDIINLTKEDAGIVAKLFNSKNNTRSGINDIVSIVPILDQEGNVKIYAVNFFDGYLLVSATKKYFPILAIIDRGTYSTDNKIDGEEFIIGEMIENINNIDTETTPELSENIARKWRKFEDNQSKLAIRSDIEDFDDEAYEEAYTGLEESWYDECFGRLYKLTESKRLFTEEEYNSYCSRAEAEFDDLFGGTKYSWQNTAIVGIYEGGELSSSYPQLKTEWYQEMNESLYGANFNCVCIAVGQLMKFFEFPSYFNWSEMHNTKPSDASSKFLQIIQRDLGVNNENASSIDDAVRVLSKYGYNCYMTTHNTKLVETSLRNQRPVYERGQRNGDIYGHAWVCDGYRYTQDYDEYKLFVLGYSPYINGKIQYVEVKGYNNKFVYRDYGTKYYHMNWGYGIRNGWYLDNLSDSPYYYPNGREDIIITGTN